MIANHLVYLSELNAKKIRVYTTSGKHLADVVSTGEFTASTPVVAAGHVVVSTFNGTTNTSFVSGVRAVAQQKTGRVPPDEGVASLTIGRAVAPLRPR